MQRGRKSEAARPTSSRRSLYGRTKQGGFGSEAPSLTAFDISSRAVVHRVEFPSDIANGSLCQLPHPRPTLESQPLAELRATLDRR